MRSGPPPLIASLPEKVAAMRRSGARKPIPPAAVAIIMIIAINMPPMIQAKRPALMICFG